MKLRKHQKKQNKALRKSLKKYDHVLYGAPTGFGKSVCILDIVKRSLDAGERVLVIAPYRKLIWQLMDTFENHRPALLMGTDSEGDTRTSPLIVASTPTLARRLRKDKTIIGGLDKILIDEAHLGFNIPDQKASTSVKLLYKYYWNTCKWVGFTATPITASGYRLEGWDKSIYMYDTAWLIDKGWLSKFTYLSVPEISPNRIKVQSSTGDYSVSDMETVTNTTAAISSVYNNYNKYAKGTKTLIFAASINHAQLIHDTEPNVNSRVIHSNMPEKQQRKILEEYKNNVFNVLINVGMLTTGFDDPEVETLIIARPIGSVRLAIQVWGRVLRKHDNIDKVTIIDLCSVWEKCGLPDDSFNWNKVKPPKGETNADDSPSIVNVILECRSCKEVIQMIKCKRDRVQTESEITTTYYCPNCNQIADIKVDQLAEEVEVQRIKTAADIDLTVNYTMKEVHNFLGEMVKYNTKAKPSWGVFIHKQCRQNDEAAYKKAIYGYAQGVYTITQAWKRIMKVYDA